MKLPVWFEEPIARTHARSAFDCGDADLNAFLHHHARRAHQQGAAKTYLAIADTTERSVLGFYSLCPASISYASVPEGARRGLARHEVPAFRLARLAVGQHCQGQGLGGQLLLAAGRRCLLVAQEVGGVALVIDAKDQAVAEWYASYGAIRLLDAPHSLVLPLKTIERALHSAGKL